MAPTAAFLFLFPVVRAAMLSTPASAARLLLPAVVPALLGGPSRRRVIGSLNGRLPLLEDRRRRGGRSAPLRAGRRRGPRLLRLAGLARVAGRRLGEGRVPAVVAPGDRHALDPGRVRARRRPPASPAARRPPHGIAAIALPSSLTAGRARLRSTGGRPAVRRHAAILRRGIAPDLRPRLLLLRLRRPLRGPGLGLPPPPLDPVRDLRVRLLKAALEELVEELHVRLLRTASDEVQLLAAGRRGSAVLLLQRLGQHPQTLELGLFLESFQPRPVGTDEIGHEVESIAVRFPLEGALRL
mmetsp:Transcript_120480/g.341381  ORF Transcript_120480/g.341381 Transcript_120480/m.341381 type:complete len:298 (-) Transcript_120480:1986-2879(-)